MTLPALTQFRVELQENGLVHLVFDCPDRSMNVFSNKAIHELGEFAEWLHRADVKGVLVRSGKATGFCAGADLTELGVAYDMIVAAPAADRFDIAFNHFFPLSHAIRRLETAGKPIAAAIAGVALGGGCELALGAHYRVVTRNRRAMLGLPECAVGLLPGAGGTQRMPRLVGVELGLEVLLLGRTLAGTEAQEAGLVHAVVDEGEEIAAAEAWLLSGNAHAVQPWDRADADPLAHAAYADAIAAHRAREMARMSGHEPAPLAILDCVELGLMQPLDGAIRAEMSVFARLIQRPEPRNMIRTMFLGKQAYDKASRDGTLSPAVIAASEAITRLVGPAMSEHADLTAALASLASEMGRTVAKVSAAEMLQLDHAVTLSGAIPAYLGGVSGVLERAA
ncbi:MAG: enoyl-CoA hydratase/isomerase family protein [Sphingomonadales bacterium]|uniref:enoyl-CoA hydratase-related protein n=1 Tax=Novosphingobium sp. AAP93 TaxID=1523427 RepID=UPI0006B8B7E2|nr:enoyl-CoA hydratase-related protein [Novosphingobium sp. AAP93]MBU6393111.1 enoyl-CoA hydratase/isomerase family protein [Sphingomonadales bacterium]